MSNVKLYFVMKKTKFKLIIFFVALTLPLKSYPFTLDLLGEVAKPLIGEAKDKAKGLTKYIWAQPYLGYGAGGGTVTKSGQSTNLKVDGALLGARGGFDIMGSLKIGVDYTVQFAHRDELENKTNTKLTMLGVGGGFDIPKTPLRGFGARYFQANLHTDLASSGDGWSAGVSTLLSAPFILLLDYRSLSFSAAPDVNGKVNARSIKQYFVAISFMLL